MSTKTNFNRVVLVAVAALGLSVLSSVPAQAAIGSNTITVTTTAGTAGLDPATAGNADSTTGALVNVTFLASVANSDSVTVSIAAKTKPSTSVGYPKALLTLVDTVTNSTAATAVRLDTTTATAGAQPQTRAEGLLNNIGIGTPITSVSARFGSFESGTGALISSPTAGTYAYASFRLHMDTATPRATGSYVFTVSINPYDTANTTNPVAANVKTIDVTIVVGAAGSTVASNAYSFASMYSQASVASTDVAASTTRVDSSVAVAATASSTPKAVVRVGLRTSTNTSTATESITVVMNLGSSGNTSGTAVGKNVTYAYTEAARVAGYLDIFIYADGTAGDATITISTPSVTFANKTVTFFATTATKLTVISATTVLGTGTNVATSGAAGTVGVIWVKATDANGKTVRENSDGASGVYAYSSAKSVVTDSGTACAYNSTLGYHTCSLTGGIAGTAIITIANLGTNENAATVKGDKAITVTVSTEAPAKLKIAFNKASYAPGERGYILISVIDAAGKVLPGASRTNAMAAGGITLAGSFSGTIPTLTGVTYTTRARVAAVDGLDSTDAVDILEFFAPYAGTSMKISATGGSLFPSSGQVEVSATAAVTDNGAAALAAVNALATTVAALRTLITTLTNLVLKIQKKVKA